MQQVTYSNSNKLYHLILNTHILLRKRLQLYLFPVPRHEDKIILIHNSVITLFLLLYGILISTAL